MSLDEKNFPDRQLDVARRRICADTSDSSSLRAARGTSDAVIRTPSSEIGGPPRLGELALFANLRLGCLPLGASGPAPYSSRPRPSLSEHVPDRRRLGRAGILHRGRPDGRRTSLAPVAAFVPTSRSVFRGTGVRIERGVRRASSRSRGEGFDVQRKRDYISGC